MDPENQDGSEVLETTDAEGEQEETADDLTPEQIEELKAKAAKADELEKKNAQLFERAKKAEANRKDGSDLSPKDLLALSKADIHPDDIEELQEFASFKKLSLAEALVNPMMKTMLAERAAERKTAEATQTKGARGAAKPTDTEVAERASATGEVPDTAEGMQALWRGRMARKTGK